MALSPMMQQYKQIKAENPDCLLMFRLGDFYELFFEDAKTVSRELELVLTGRDCGDGERAPMCGVPYHAVESYLTKLIGKGYRVAICEQLEDPATTKGLVKRGVVRILSPGTVTEGGLLKEGQNNYLAALTQGDMGFGVAFADVSTGEVFATEVLGDDRKAALFAECAAFSPAEAVVETGVDEDIAALLRDRIGALITRGEKAEDAEVEVGSADDGFVTDLAERAAELLVLYIKHTQKADLGYIKPVRYYKSEAFMRLDAFTRRNLEISEAMRSGEKKGSLLWVLDKTHTGMGARLLKQWLDRPLINSRAICNRLDGVEELKNAGTERKEIISLLKGVVDMERITTRLVYGTANARDLKALEATIKQLPFIKERLSFMKSAALKGLCASIDELEDIGTSIANTIADDPPVTVREGGIIKTGANSSVDELRMMMSDGKTWISHIEADEKQKTGIRTLKVGYNKVFGYYIEVSKSFKDEVPERYIRRQTLANCERFVTPELKDMESRVIGAKDKLVALEYELFTALREYILDRARRIQKTAAAVAETDVYCALAEVAAQNGYVRPEVDDSGVIDIKDGRHPVVERYIGDAYFVPNDCLLDGGKNRLALITGPNMAGKSTYMRQIALAVIMAQIGSFVPAKSARIGVVDRVFTRVGASDDLATGSSTFMIEMTELAAILKNATAASLIIYDEIGRGTSTYDGMSIARAALEYTVNHIKAKTLFATHYHELTSLEGELDGVINYNVAAKKRGDGVVFLRKIVRGATDDSYGIEVAKLAGVPDKVVNRARQVLKSLESTKPAPKTVAVEEDNLSFSAFAEQEIAAKLRAIDINTLTPIEAMGLLYELKKKAEI
ncbi:MAG: DNA mismatch repair protein MutS [Ruminococcaceae bacterium]|nr:DNA mismatch repair protein MutS [Oscillospiraceae bacterium]